MKKIIMIASACFVILAGTSIYAGCNSCSSSYNNSNSSCGQSVDPYADPCTCTDPSCGWTWEQNCTTRSECCAAFGNMGAN